MQIRQITFKDVVDHVKSEHTLQQSGKISLTAKKLASLEAEILTLNNEEKKSIVPDNPLQEEELRDAMLAYNLAKLRVDAKDNHIAWLRLQEYNAACDEFKKEQEKTKFNLFNKMRKAGNTLEMANGYLNLGCIVALLFGSSAAFAFSLGAQSVTILSTVLEYVEFALP
ncbi:MAG: hypothetical protein JO131_10465, partial [Gammaproteobacteria bacterium]|nr:hypothetical protein [Gammaproteobacteria bacterium]